MLDDRDPLRLLLLGSVRPPRSQNRTFGRLASALCFPRSRSGGTARRYGLLPPSLLSLLSLVVQLREKPPS
jgi:hypothetical protein